MQHTAPGYNKVNVKHPYGTVKDIDGTIQVRFNAERYNPVTVQYNRYSKATV